MATLMLQKGMHPGNSKKVETRSQNSGGKSMPTMIESNKLLESCKLAYDIY